jgi:macrolide transport system ATP-binding/permease protein
VIKFVRILAARIVALFWKRRLDDELQEELRSHLEMAIDLNLHRGMSLEQARREAFVAFGGIEKNQANLPRTKRTTHERDRT